MFRSWRGPEVVTDVLRRYPCSVYRGARWDIVKPLLPKIVPGLKFDAICLTGNEVISTVGVDCDGRLLP